MLKRSEQPATASGDAMHKLMRRLYPICRSITGDGVRQTLAILRESIPLEIHEVPSGTRCYDWTVPREWNIRDAHIIDPAGRKIVDFRISNLHVLNYATPINARLNLDELKPHLFTLPELPDAVPYRTSYYEDNWGICMSHRQFEGLAEGTYEVFIDSTLEDGSLTYAELLIEGRLSEEILISTYVCHPSMCNDNLSGIVEALALAETLGRRDTEFSYRFLFVPETIGAIVWLSRNEQIVERIRGGMVFNSLGDPGPITYKKSRRGDAWIDRAACHVLRHRGDYRIKEFAPTGSDERQFCSPGFDLPVGVLMRSDYDFEEYHTSLDDLDLVTASQLGDSLEAAMAIIDVIENDRRYRNLNPKGEPQLGRRGLYDQIGASRSGDIDRLAVLWALNLSDGENSVLEIAERADMPFAEIAAAAAALRDGGLLEELISNPVP